ncbi:hypothetical protein IWW34DRAFT_795350 [Fusarium oxysporum f. sp. albedinis]|nr:hypothetical protein IWW34DRAFT_795350 [Fusarium oxysporum f. sp. albedinis]
MAIGPTNVADSLGTNLPALGRGSSLKKRATPSCLPASRFSHNKDKGFSYISPRYCLSSPKKSKSDLLIHWSRPRSAAGILDPVVIDEPLWGVPTKALPLMYLEKSRAEWRMTLTNKTPYAMGNKDEGVGRSVTSYSVASWAFRIRRIRSVLRSKRKSRSMFSAYHKTNQKYKEITRLGLGHCNEPLCWRRMSQYGKRLRDLRLIHGYIVLYQLELSNNMDGPSF